MFAHHHLDSRRLVRLLIFIWALLLLLVLLPIHARGQETMEPIMPVEVLDDNPVLSPGLLNAIAAEMLFLWFSMIAFVGLDFTNSRRSRRRP